MSFVVSNCPACGKQVKAPLPLPKDRARCRQCGVLLWLSFSSGKFVVKQQMQVPESNEIGTQEKRVVTSKEKSAEQSRGSEERPASKASDTAGEGQTEKSHVINVATEYASPWLRLGAFVIDLIIMVPAFVIAIIISPIFMLVGLPPDPDLLGQLSMSLAWLLYFSVMESLPRQATVGKMAVGIKVGRVDGERLGFGQAFVRNLFKFFSYITFFIGYLMAFFTQKKQMLHDMMSSCVVIKPDPSGRDSS